MLRPVGPASHQAAFDVEGPFPFGDVAGVERQPKSGARLDQVAGGGSWEKS